MNIDTIILIAAVAISLVVWFVAQLAPGGELNRRDNERDGRRGKE